MKIFKKGLSILLAVIIACGCLSTAAMAVIVEREDLPASVQADLNNLGAAYAALAANGANEQWSYSRVPNDDDPSTNPAGGYNTTITDLSPGGYVFKVAVAFEKLLQNDEYIAYGDAALAEARRLFAEEDEDMYPFPWWSNLYFDTVSYLDLKGAQNSLMGAFTNMKQKTGITDTGRRMNAFSKDVRWTGSIGSNPAHAFSTVNRSEITALRDVPDWDALTALPPEGIVTQIRFGMNARVATRDANFNHFDSRMPTTYGHSNTQIANLKDYYAYFFESGIMTTTDPFALSMPDVIALNAANTAAKNKLASFSAADIAKFFPQNEDVVQFMMACNEAENIADFIPNIAYFQDPGGFIDRIASGTYYDPTDLATMTSIWAEEEFHYQRLLKTSNAGKAKLTADYGMNFAAITGARGVLERDKQLVELALFKAGMDAYHETHFPGHYDCKGYSDDELIGLLSEYAGFLEEIDGYRQDVINEVFTGGTGYIELFAMALVYEATLRALDVDLKYTKVFFSHYLATDLASLDSGRLIYLLNGAQSFSDEFFERYDLTKDIFTEEDMERTYGAYPQKIPQLIDEMYRTLEGRFVAQVNTAVALYTDVGEVSWENVALLRRMIGFVEPAIYDRLKNTDYIPQDIREKYLWLFDEILKEFNEFTKDGGYGSFAQFESVYPVRKVRPDDLARHGDEDYVVTEEKVDKVIEKLDAFLSGQDFKDLTNIDLAETITGLLDGLWSDSIINALVGLLYPLVLQEFENAFDGLPDESVDPDTKTDVKVTKKDLYDVLKDTASTNTIKEMQLYPDLLARNLPPEYRLAKEALSAAKPHAGFDQDGTEIEGTYSKYPTNAWNHSSIRKITKRDEVVLDEWFIPKLDAEGKEVKEEKIYYEELTLKWGVDDPADVDDPDFANFSKQERFIRGISAALQGVWPLMAPLLCGQPLSLHANNVGSIIGYTEAADGLCTSPDNGQNVKCDSMYLDLNMGGTNGYAEVLTPIFEALLGDDTAGLPTVDKLKALATPRELVEEILNPVLYFATEKLPAAPLKTLLSALPNIAFALSMDNVIPLLNALALDLKYVADGRLDVRIATSSSSWNASCGKNMSTHGMEQKGAISLNIAESLLGGGSGIDLGFMKDLNALLDMVAGALGIKLPLINGGLLATMGELVSSVPSKRPAGERWYIEANKADVLVYVVQYVLGALEDPALLDGIANLFPEGEERDNFKNTINGDLVGGIIENVSKNPDDAIAAIVELVNPAGTYEMEDFSWLFMDQPSIPAAKYTDSWMLSDANFVLENLDGFVNGVMKFLGIYDTNGNLYSMDNLLKSLLGGVYTNSTLTSVALLVKNLIGSLNLPDVVYGLAEDQLDVNLKAWDKYTENYNWGFKDGDKNGFFNGIMDLLRPLVPILRVMLLDDTSISVFDTVEVVGYNGYAQGIIPLLEAFGAPNIMTPDEYRRAVDVNEDSLIAAILMPLMSVIDEVSADPVNVLLKKLPGIAYFMQSGGLNTAVNNAMHTLNVLLDTARPVYSLQLFDMDLTLSSILGLLIGNTQFELPNRAVEKFLFGEVTSFTSKNGEKAYTLVANKADTLTALLRFVVEFLYHRGNRNALIDMLTGVVGLKSDFLKQADAFFDAMREIFVTKYNGVDVVLQTLLGTLKVVGAFTNASNSLIDGYNKNWVAILNVLKNSGVGFLKDFASNLEKFLDGNFADVIDSRGAVASGAIPFFTAVIAWVKNVWSWILRYIFFGWIWMD